MRLLLVALIGFLTLSTVFNWEPGPMPGLSIKNLLLYCLMMALLFQSAVQRRFVLQLSVIPVLFVVLIGYAVLTYVAIVLVIDYPRYGILANGFALKNRLVDQMIFFLVFFYSVRKTEDAVFVLRFILAAWVLSHAAALMDALGLAHIGDIERRGDGRVQGAVGESNQYGAFVALSVCAVIAAAAVSRAGWRWLWGTAALVTAAALLMTVSRGAFVGMLAAAVGGLYLFRRYIPGQRLFVWSLGSTAAVIAVLVVVGLTYGDLLYERIVGGASGDLSAVSSSRTEIWSQALATMWQTPITLLTGFGWNAYWTMPFRYSPHNYYLSQWFNLGLPGLICSVLLLVIPVRVALSAYVAAPANIRAHLAGFVMGAIAFAVSTFFVDLYMPWLYFWAYAGLIMRLAVNVRQPVAESVQAQPTRGLRQGADPYGWTGAAPR